MGVKVADDWRGALVSEVLLTRAMYIKSSLIKDLDRLCHAKVTSAAASRETKVPRVRCIVKCKLVVVDAVRSDGWYEMMGECR